MIVVMAAGIAAKMTAIHWTRNDSNGANCDACLSGDQEFDSPKTLAAFALG